LKIEKAMQRIFISRPRAANWSARFILRTAPQRIIPTCSTQPTT